MDIHEQRIQRILIPGIDESCNTFDVFVPEKLWTKLKEEI
jgi:hypothetical protein